MITSTVILVYLSVAVAMSCISFVVYGFDKRQARHGGRRIPEKWLHVLALVGGWAGALVGQQVFRHKTQKLRFRLVFWVIVLIHGVLIYLWLTRKGSLV